jgi:hypothetical protein
VRTRKLIVRPFESPAGATYFTAAGPLAATRPWQAAMAELVKTKHGKWGERWGRAITHKEHIEISENGKIDERRAYYQLWWHLGSSQSDIANFHAEDVDWRDHVISIARSKTKVV